jgi:hypothetical protein
MSTSNPLAEPVEQHPPIPLHAITVAPAGPAPANPAPANPDWHAAWVAALDGLEFDLDAAEQLLEDVRLGREVPVGDPWSPPPGLGPLPLDLAPRADAILARQLTVASAVAAGISHNRRQATMAARVENGRDTGRPAYLDCAM